MQNKHLGKILALLTLAILVISWQTPNAPVSKAAFGISPPWIRNLHALPGTSFEQTIVLSTNNPAEDMKVIAKVSGDRNLINWVSIENQENLLLAKGQTQIPMKVKVEVPKRAGLKLYKGNIEIRLQPTNPNQTGGVAIALGANASIELEVVGDAFVDYKVSSIETQAIQEGGAIKLNLRLENRGNTQVETLKTEIEVWNETETEKLQTLTSEKILIPVDPYETQNTIIEIPAPNLAPGKYWLKVKAYKEDKVIFETKLYLPVEKIPAPKGTLEAMETALETDQPLTLPEDLNNLKIAEAETKAPEAIPVETPEEVRPAAPEVNNLYLMIAFGSMGIALLAVGGMITFMILFLKKQNTNK